MFSNIINTLLSGDIYPIMNSDVVREINETIKIILSKKQLDSTDIEVLGQIVHIGNIVYNNTDLDDDKQPIENGTYDIILELYKKYNTSFQVGAEPVHFNQISTAQELESIPLVNFTDVDEEGMLFSEQLFQRIPLTITDIQENLVTFRDITSKKYRDTSHEYPELVGSLDKCKYVLNSQAIAKDVFDDPKVKILERDFFEPHFRKEIITRNTILRLMIELKYDGTSVVVTVRHGMVVSAISRGDTGQDKATDYTPILYGYRFPHCDKNIEATVKCEAVMTRYDLIAYNSAKNASYANCRSAINGLFSSNDGSLYQKFITLIPLKVVMEFDGEVLQMDRDVEIAFMNKLFRTKEILRAAYLEGTFSEVMFMINKFVDEAEFIRPSMPTMYDGVVISYMDRYIIEALGRENFINKYSIAVKFNSLKKQTVLRAITYTVGCNGLITPMAHYDPVEFFGTIHTKSSLSSVERFNRSNLKINNVVSVEYLNDVIPYMDSLDLDVNNNNPNPILKFIDLCPCCGTTLEFSDSGKSARCTNVGCRARIVARMAKMTDKLGMKDFAEATMEKLNKSHISELFEMTEEELEPIIGPINAAKFVDSVRTLKQTPSYDYNLIGSLGFADISRETWRKIFCRYDFNEFLYNMMNKSIDDTLNDIKRIKGIGDATIDTIRDEFDYFLEDILYIHHNFNVMSSLNIVQRKIRCTGFRDSELMNYLCENGFDASDSSVTKDTYILLIPAGTNKETYVSSKLSKIGEYTLVIAVDVFKENIASYLE